MGNLIDEILQEFSRACRDEASSARRSNMSALACEIAVELNDAKPDHPVEVEIEDGLLAQADLALVRSVLQNLSRRGGMCSRAGRIDKRGGGCRPTASDRALAQPAARWSQKVSGSLYFAAW